jgi:hypothetical protein
VHEIKLTDGTTTISLNDGSNVWTLGYSLATPQPGATDVSDSIELLFLVPSATVRSVDAMLEKAERRLRTRRGPRIYVTVKMTADTETWRSELYQGQLMADRLLDDAFIGKVRMTLVVQRAPFWEGAEAEIPLINYDMYGDDDPATGGVAVPNDPETGCWVEIDGGDVAGALPAPVRLRIVNSEAAARAYRDFLIGIDTTSAISAIHVIQAEDEATPYGSDTASVLASDGSYWTSASFTTTNELLGVWAFGTGLAQGSEGRWQRLVARLFQIAPTYSAVLWPVIYDASIAMVLWTGPEIRLSAGIPFDNLVDFGPIPVPPGPWDANYADVKLGLWGRSTEPTTVGIDYFYLMPMDAYRKVDQIALGVAADKWVEFDEIERRYYIETAATDGRTAVHVPSEAPLVVWPGVDQRVHLLFQLDSGDMPIGDGTTVSMWYRPRRLTL